MDLLSRREELLLLAVWRLQDDAYGAAILVHLDATTGASWSFGGVYAPLDRLARRGFVRSAYGDPTPERGGRRKRVYRLTPAGLAALQHVRAVHEAAWQGLPPLSFAPAP